MTPSTETALNTVIGQSERINRKHEYLKLRKSEPTLYRFPDLFHLAPGYGVSTPIRWR